MATTTIPQPHSSEAAPTTYRAAVVHDFSSPLSVEQVSMRELGLPIFETVLNGITIVGSIVGTRKDLREVFAHHAAGKTRVIRETRPLDQVNQAIADVEAGRVAARVVLEP
jgi:hypothetical protein